MNFLKRQWSKEKVYTGLSLFALALAVFSPELAMAGAGNNNLGQIFQEGNFKDIITLGFGIFAFIKIVDYFVGLSSETALKGLVIPAILVFLTFKWYDVLGWFGLQ